MNPIKIGEVNYSSKYGKDGLRAKTEYVPNQEVQNDSFNSKYKSKNNKKAAGIIGTIALMAASAFAAYKGKGQIQKFIKGTGENINKAVGDFAKKHTNMAAAGKSLKEAGGHLKKACSHPSEVITKAAGTIAKPFKSAWKGIKNIFTHTKN